MPRTRLAPSPTGALHLGNARTFLVNWLLIYDRLQLGPAPSYTHLPLVVGQDGRRLAKRHGDSRLSHYRAQGASAERIVGLLAEWCGCGERREMSAAEFCDAFNLDLLDKRPIMFTASDNDWLLRGA